MGARESKGEREGAGERERSERWVGEKRGRGRRIGARRAHGPMHLDETRLNRRRSHAASGVPAQTLDIGCGNVISASGACRNLTSAMCPTRKVVYARFRPDNVSCPTRQGSMTGHASSFVLLRRDSSFVLSRQHQDNLCVFFDNLEQTLPNHPQNERGGGMGACISCLRGDAIRACESSCSNAFPFADVQAQLQSIITSQAVATFEEKCVPAEYDCTVIGC
mmetsp:Transcript_849/g.1687  ORF Transcript_849/g.1687 Transcript_849/m.1687 type:complete len:221 (+) Transcript_849:1772-2434(+)